MGFSRQEYGSGLPFPAPGESSQPRDQTCISCISCIGKQILYHCATWEAWKTLEVPKKLKIELPYDPAIRLLGIYPEKMKILIQKDTCTPMFKAALFVIAKTWKKTKCPSTEWIRKMWYVYIVYTVDYYSPIKKNEIRAFVMMWMDLETILLSEVSRTEKEKYHIISLICGSLKRVQMNLFTKQK